MIKELVCITCPSGCHLQAVLDEQNNVLSVFGNRCPRGEAYARSELIAPRRMLTSTVRIEGALHPLLPVATSAPILKSRIFLVMEEIRSMLHLDVMTVTGKTLGHPVRSLKTPFSKTFAKMESDPNVKPEEILAFGTGALRKAVKEGDTNGSYMAGECAGMVKKIEPAKDIIEDLIGGAEKLILEAQNRFLA